MINALIQSSNNYNISIDYLIKNLLPQANDNGSKENMIRAFVSNHNISFDDLTRMVLTQLTDEEVKQKIIDTFIENKSFSKEELPSLLNLDNLPLSKKFDIILNANILEEEKVQYIQQIAPNEWQQKEWLETIDIDNRDIIDNKNIIQQLLMDMKDDRVFFECMSIAKIASQFDVAEIFQLCYQRSGKLFGALQQELSQHSLANTDTLTEEGQLAVKNIVGENLQAYHLGHLFAYFEAMLQSETSVFKNWINPTILDQINTHFSKNLPLFLTREEYEKLSDLLVSENSSVENFQNKFSAISVIIKYIQSALKKAELQNIKTPTQLSENDKEQLDILKGIKTLQAKEDSDGNESQYDQLLQQLLKLNHIPEKDFQEAHNSIDAILRENKENINKLINLAEKNPVALQAVLLACADGCSKNPSSVLEQNYCNIVLGGNTMALFFNEVFNEMAPHILRHYQDAIGYSSNLFEVKEIQDAQFCVATLVKQLMDEKKYDNDNVPPHFRYKYLIATTAVIGWKAFLEIYGLNPALQTDQEEIYAAINSVVCPEENDYVLDTEKLANLITYFLHTALELPIAAQSKGVYEELQKAVAAIVNHKTKLPTAPQRNTQQKNQQTPLDNSAMLDLAMTAKKTRIHWQQLSAGTGTVFLKLAIQ